MLRIRKRRFIFVLLCAAIILFVFIAPFHTADATNQNSFIVITVNDGDTLWNIAQKYNNTGKDIRRAIHEIKEINDIKKSIIFPGQQLKIPVKNIETPEL